MKEVFELEMDFLPISVNKYLVPSYTKKDRRIIPLLRESAESTAYKEKMAIVLKRAIHEQGWDKKVTEEDHWILECEFVQTRRNQDSHNFFKILIDSLVGHVIMDDKNVLVKTNNVKYDKKGKTKIRLTRADYIGLFDNEEQINRFESDFCSSCSKQVRCVKLDKARTGDLRSGITVEDGSPNCSSYEKRK